MTGSTATLRFALAMVAACGGMFACSSGKAGLAAGFTDSITFAYVPINMADFEAYEHYRQDNNVVQEAGRFDYAIRNSDYACLELGLAEFPALQKLAGDGSISREDAEALPSANGKLLIAFATVARSKKPAGHRVGDAILNTLSVMGAMASPGPTVVKRSDMMDYEHRLRVIYLDKRANTFIDTTSLVKYTAQSGSMPRKGGESLEVHHYLSLIKAVTRAGVGGR